MPELLRIKGDLLLHDGAQRSIPQAESSFERSIEIARQQGSVFWELKTAVSLARLRISESRHADALDVLTLTCGKFTEGFAMADMRNAQAMITQLSRR